MPINKSYYLFLSFFLCLSICFVACQQPQYPEFETIKNIKVLTLKADKVRLAANAVVKNPNPVGANITGSDLEIILMDKQKAKVQQLQPTLIPANSSFDLPFEFEFSPKDLWKSDLLGSALEIFGSKKVRTNITGTITVEVGGIEVNLPVDVEKEIPIKKE